MSIHIIDTANHALSSFSTNSLLIKLYLRSILFLDLIHHWCILWWVYLLISFNWTALSYWWFYCISIYVNLRLIKFDKRSFIIGFSKLFSFTLTRRRYLRIIISVTTRALHSSYGFNFLFQDFLCILFLTWYYQSKFDIFFRLL